MHRFRVGRLAHAYGAQTTPVARCRSQQPSPPPYKRSWNAETPPAELYRPAGIVNAMPVAVLLSVAIVSEVAATVALRYSDGFTRPGPIAIVVVGYGISFWLLALVLRDMSIGATYAVWSAVGTALIAAIGVFAFGEPATALKLASLGLIIIGVVGLNMAGSH
jgi:small multidrug resistance pump